MSADSPGSGNGTPALPDHARPAESDRTRPADHAPAQPQADAGRSQQPAPALNRTDYNQARHAEPPVRRHGDAGNRVPPDTRAAGSHGDRRAERAAPRQPADAGTHGHSRAETLNRADYNLARHAQQPIERSEASGQDGASTTAARPGDGSTRRSADLVPDQAPRSAQARHEVAENPASEDGRPGEARETSTPDVQAKERHPPAGQPYSWLHVAEADRTVGDTTPTGIGLKPSGEQLLDMESSKRSRLDAFRTEVEKEDALDGLHSEVEEDVKTLQGILDRPPEGHAVQAAPEAPAQLTPYAPPGLDAGGLAAAGLMAGVLLAETGRRIHDMLKHEKAEVTLCQWATARWPRCGLCSQGTSRSTRG